MGRYALRSASLQNHKRACCCLLLGSIGCIIHQHYTPDVKVVFQNHTQNYRTQGAIQHTNYIIMGLMV